MCVLCVCVCAECVSVCVLALRGGWGVYVLGVCVECVLGLCAWCVCLVCVLCMHVCVCLPVVWCMHVCVCVLSVVYACLLYTSPSPRDRG